MNQFVDFANRKSQIIQAPDGRTAGTLWAKEKPRTFKTGPRYRCFAIALRGRVGAVPEACIINGWAEWHGHLGHGCPRAGRR